MKWFAAGLVAFAIDGHAHDAQAYEIAETYLSDFKIEQSINGVKVEFLGRVNLGADFSFRSRPTINIHVVVNLGDLQRKFPAIVSTIPLPSENCRSFSANNPIVNLSNPQLTFADGKSRFHTEGSVAVWDCRENPIPNSKVEWRIKKIAFIKTKVPVVVTWPGNPIKNKLGTQPFAIDIPFDVVSIDGGSAKVVPGEANLTLNGQYADITRTIISGVGVDLNKLLNQAIQRALDPKVVTASIPKEYLDAGLKLDATKFVEINPTNELGLDVTGKLTLSLKMARQVARLFWDKYRSGQ